MHEFHKNPPQAGTQFPDKATLRQHYKSLRRNMSPAEVHDKSESIAARLFAMPLWQESQTVLLYLAFQNEVDTDALYHHGWQMGKRLLIPICGPKNGWMEASILHSMDQLVPNRYGIRELPSTLQQIVAPECIDLCIIPGLAFDAAGMRLGFGAGYYDRYLPRLRPGVKRVALAYQYQLHSTALPHSYHDLPMDYLITERTIYCF